MTNQELKEIRERLETIRTKDDIQKFGTKEKILYTIRRLVETVEQKEFEIKELLDYVERLREDNEELQKLVDKFSEANRRLRIAVANQE